jgi:hypothetical protein
VEGGFWHKLYKGSKMDANLIKKIGIQVGGAHFPTVFADYQEDYTKKVLQECYHVLQYSQSDANEYLAIDLMFDICKHFGLNPQELYNVA